MSIEDLGARLNFAPPDVKFDEVLQNAKDRQAALARQEYVNAQIALARLLDRHSAEISTSQS